MSNNATADRSKKILITHSGPFHTDDVFATALLLHFFPDAEVIRTRDASIIETGDIVYDVGRVYQTRAQKFDHHQPGALQRSNGITYSSFGLLWKEYGIAFCGGDATVANFIEQKFVVPIDANDNGQPITRPIFETVQAFTIDDVTRIFNPLQWLDSSEGHDTQFHKNVLLAQQLLDRLLRHAKDTLMGQKAFLDAYAGTTDKRIVVLEKPADVNGIMDQCSELLYLISPRPDQTWGALAVRDSLATFTPRRPFPESWRAQDETYLQKLSGVPDVIFCHATGFLAVAKSRDGAIALAQASLKAVD